MPYRITFPMPETALPASETISPAMFFAPRAAPAIACSAFVRGAPSAPSGAGFATISPPGLDRLKKTEAPSTLNSESPDDVPMLLAVSSARGINRLFSPGIVTMTFFPLCWNSRLKPRIGSLIRLVYQPYMTALTWFTLMRYFRFPIQPFCQIRMTPRSESKTTFARSPSPPMTFLNSNLQRDNQDLFSVGSHKILNLEFHCH